MISVITGTPGSGKTARSVSILMDRVSSFKQQEKKLNEKQKDHELYIYQNFADFELEKFKEDYDHKYVYTLDYDKLYNSFKVCKDLSTESEKIDYMKSKKLFNSILFIDESHLYFSKEDPILIFLLSYHRHFNIDIFLITQNLDLIHYKYKTLVEEFHVAQRRSLSFSDNYLTYFLYSSHMMYKQHLLKTYRFKKDPKVFTYYKSGGSITSKNQTKRQMVVVLSLVLFSLIVSFFVFKHLFTTFYKDEEVPIQKSVSQVSTNKTQEIILEDKNLDKFFILKFYCYKNSNLNCLTNSLKKINRNFVISLDNRKSYSHPKDPLVDVFVVLIKTEKDLSNLFYLYDDFEEFISLSKEDNKKSSSSPSSVFNNFFP
jgi:zona occludens toxin